MSISAMKQALEALALFASDESDDGQMAISAYEALRKTIEEAEKQKPVAWVVHYSDRREFVWGNKPEFLSARFLGAKVLSAEPLYAAPVHISDMSKERVDETAKDRHKWVEQPDLARVGEVGVWGDKREWVGLDDDIPGLGLVTEEFYNGMLCAEDILRKRNT